MPAKTQTAKQQFVAEQDGATVVVLQGARFRADDPIVKANGSLFEATKPKSRAKRAA
jgi:hypothetical protein